MHCGLAHKEHMNDRFIPSRKNIEFPERAEMLDELLLAQKNEEEMKMQDVNGSPIEPPAELTDTQKGYRSLLQNQLLGIKDMFTIHQLGGASHLFQNFPYERRFSLFHGTEQYGQSETSVVKCADKENSGFKLPSFCGFQEEEHQIISPVREERKIPRVPFKVLDAPALQDDFYLNVVDWSSKGILAVGLGPCAYLWSPQGKVTKLTDVGATNSITSVGWSLNGSYLSIGTYSGAVQIWDANKAKQIRVLKGHEGRVGSVAWNSTVLSTGSRDKNIMLSDIKMKENSFAELQGHKQEVCGLKWSSDEQQLASGGNDNKIFIWNSHNVERPSGKYTSHTAAVKALAWSPHQHGLLVSGGGTADRSIRSWNTLTNIMVNCVDTGSQVCNLLFSKNVDELVSSHGYSQNHVFLWKYNTMRKLATLSGHTSRVLYLAASNDGETIVTGAGDETLRFWRVFPQTQNKYQSSNLLLPSTKDLR